MKIECVNGGVMYLSDDDVKPVGVRTRDEGSCLVMLDNGREIAVVGSVDEVASCLGMVPKAKKTKAKSK
jgi:hypothetical protein